VSPALAETADALTAAARRRPWSGLVSAFTFLTIVPLPAWMLGDAGDDLSPALAWFPITGALIGAVAGLLRLACRPAFGHAPSTALAMVALVLITGGLHQDGLADTADGLGVRGDRVRRLAAMRDSAIGAFGVLALIGWALLVFTALQPLDGHRGLVTLVAVGAVSRLAAPLHALAAPPARPDGLGAGLKVEPLRLGVAIVSAAAITVAVVGPVKGVVSLGVCVLVASLSALLARQAIGGRTGDTLGASVAVAEAAVCLAFLALWR
jgi:adenosylcobinamide-GDP ribazoletransferase